jgi:hypothetical protein
MARAAIPTSDLQITTQIGRMLDTLFALRVALHEHPAARDAAILQVLTPEPKALVAGIIHEWQDMWDDRTTQEAKMTTQVKMAVRAFGVAVRGTHLQAPYGDGRLSWDTERLLALAERYPKIRDCLHVGEPIVSIRACAQRHAAPPLLYDTHGV